jgi:amino acid transporter
MFDLEKSIAEWREQMLAAGIKSPVPLEELETHLREEIAWQTKSGLDKAEAFKAGIQKIGQGQMLQNEFNKVESDHKVWQAVMLIIGWLAAACMLVVGLVRLDFFWEFLSFWPRWNFETFRDVLIILVAETGIWFLAMANRDKASRVVSLLVCLLLAGFAVVWFYELAQPRTGWSMGRPYTPPLWYRSSLTLLLCLPGIFWGWQERRHRIQKRVLTRRNQTVSSS